MSDYEFGMMFGELEHPAEWVRRMELGLVRPKPFVCEWVARQLWGMQMRQRIKPAIRSFQREHGLKTRADVVRFQALSLQRLRELAAVTDLPKKRIHLEPGTGLV
jgi:transposase